MRIRLLLLALLAVSALSAQSKKIVIMGMSNDLFSELRRSSPSSVKLVNISNPGTSADVVAVVADSPQESSRRQKLLQEVSDAHAIIGNPSLELIKAAKNLEWVQITSAGVKPYLYPELVNSDVVMTNAQIMSSDAIADHGFAMLLALTRRLHIFMPAREQENWDRSNHNLQQLRGKTAVVIGTGGIGSNVAQRAKAFGMTVIGVDPEEFPPRPSRRGRASTVWSTRTGSTGSFHRRTRSSSAPRTPKTARACSAPSSLS